MGMFEKQMLEMGEVGEALKELQSVKEGAEMLVPLSSGIFVKATLGKTDEFLVNVGSSVSVKKKGEDVVALIKEQQVEIRKVLLEATQQIEKLARNAQELQQEINTLIV